MNLNLKKVQDLDEEKRVDAALEDLLNMADEDETEATNTTTKKKRKRNKKKKKQGQPDESEGDFSARQFEPKGIEESKVKFDLGLPKETESKGYMSHRPDGAVTPDNRKPGRNYDLD